jgi:hypothetical protein
MEDGESRDHKAADPHPLRRNGNVKRREAWTFNLLEGEEPVLHARFNPFVKLGACARVRN